LLQFKIDWGNIDETTVSIEDPVIEHYSIAIEY